MNHDSASRNATMIKNPHSQIERQRRLQRYPPPRTRPLTVTNLRDLQLSGLPVTTNPAEWTANLPLPTIDPLTNRPLPPEIALVPPRLGAHVTPASQHQLRAATDYTLWGSTELPPPRPAVPESSFRSTMPTPIAPHPTMLAPTCLIREIPRTAVSPITATAPPPAMDSPSIAPAPPSEDVHEAAAQAARDLISNPRRFRLDPNGSFREPMTDSEMEDPFLRNDSREWNRELEGLHWSPYSGDCVPSRWAVRRYKCWYWIRTRIFRRERTVVAWRVDGNQQMHRRAFRL